MTSDDVDEQYAAAVAESERLWRAPLGELDTRRLIELARVIREHEQNRKQDA